MSEQKRLKGQRSSGPVTQKAGGPVLRAPFGLRLQALESRVAELERVTGVIRPTPDHLPRRRSGPRCPGCRLEVMTTRGRCPWCGFVFQAVARRQRATRRASR
jgi:hypothetical protein